MCGIIGYSGKDNAAPVLFSGLKKLEYRGYDSCGIATFKDSIHIKKDSGKVNEVHEKNNFFSLPGKIGIAHTRWATHGKVNKENAHPHLSNNRRIAVVHNGIIENFLELKEFLKKENFVFYSECDSEVIPNLIEYYMKKDLSFVDACKSSFKKLVGQYAIVVLNDEGKMIAIRKEAPLVIGIGKEELFLASDVIGFLEHTKSVIFLEEKDMVIINNKNFKIFNLEKNSFVIRPFSKIEWDVKEVEKGNFDHFFMKEVLEQAEIIEKLAKINKDAIKDIAKWIRNADKIYITGCGSAFHAGLYGAYLFSKIAKIHATCCLASEFHNLNCFITEKNIVIAVSQSGETADTLNAIKEAKSRGAKIFSICNVDNSSLVRESNKTILQNVGPEICVLSTKSYTSQIAILALIAYELGGRLEEGKNKLKELSGQVYYLTSDNSRRFIKNLSEKLKDNEHIYIIGRSLEYITALESALKIKEASYIHAEAFAGGELKHGSIALITDSTPCIVFVSKENEKDILNNIIEIKSRGAYIIGISDKNLEIFDFFIKVKEANELNPILQIIPIQILAYRLSVLRGCNPDKPRNLAKSVVVR